MNIEGLKKLNLSTSLFLDVSLASTKKITVLIFY